MADASNGEQTLSAIQCFEPDLVILDWTLPDIGGIEISRLVRDQGDRTAILFLTAKGSAENKTDALNAGADDCITNPSAWTSSSPASSPFSDGRWRLRS